MERVRLHLIGEFGESSALNPKKVLSMHAALSVGVCMRLMWIGQTGIRVWPVEGS